MIDRGGVTMPALLTSAVTFVNVESAAASAAFQSSSLLTSRWW